MSDLNALTLHQPWGWLIASGYKPIENRDWPPPRWMIGKPLAIHAGKTYDGEGEAEVRQRFPEVKFTPPSYTRTSAILGVVKVAGVISREQRNIEHPGVTFVDEALKAGLITEPELRWFVGEYGWVLREVVKFQLPVHCRGAQKLWRVPADILPAVREQFRQCRPPKVDA